jgi:hypothetical protein
MLEGEGSFYRRKTGYTAVQIPNNDTDVIKECEQFLRDRLILFNTYEVKAGRKRGYKIIVSEADTRSLYTQIKCKMECRLNEFQQILGTSETECDLTVNVDWLIGVWEAEGSFIISRNHRGHLIPKIELDSTNERIIRKVILTLKHLGLSWYVKDYDRGKKPFTKITIQGHKRCKRFCRCLSWVTTRNQKRAKVMLDFCNFRLGQPLNTPVCDIDYSYWNQMKQLNS